LSTTNPTWTGPGSNLGLRGERLATNRLSHGTAGNASNLAITSFNVLATTHCDIDEGSTYMYKTDVTQHPPYATAAHVITIITGYHKARSSELKADDRK
jgi:hypothetical protein